MASHPLADRVLLHCLGIVGSQDWERRPPPAEVLDRDDWTYLAAKAAHHGLAGLASRNLDWAAGRIAVPSPVATELASLRARVLTQNLARRAAARQFAEALERAAIPFIVLKGVALAAETYGDLSLRGFNDFDVVVPMADVWRAHELAVGLGYVPVRLSLADSLRAGAHALGMARRSDGMGLDIHWRIAPNLPEPALDLAWQHALPAPQGASLPGLRLRPELALVHLAQHFHTGQYAILRPLVDFHFTARTSPPDPALVRTLSDALGLGSVVAISSALASRWLATPPVTDASHSWPARAANRVLDAGFLVAAADRSRIGNWLRYLAASGGAAWAARELRGILFPGPLALAQFFNARFSWKMYPAYYWRQVVKVLTLSPK